MRQLREKEEISEVLFSLFAIVVDQELSGALLLWWLLKAWIQYVITFDHSI
jgi:hypothetical protein